MAWAPDYKTWYDPRPKAYGPDDPGGGAPLPEILELHGVASRDWWLPSEQVPDERLTWPSLLQHWDAIEADFQWHLHLDLASGVLRHRSFRWFRVRVVKLLSESTSLRRELGLDKPDESK